MVAIGDGMIGCFEVTKTMYLHVSVESNVHISYVMFYTVMSTIKNTHLYQVNGWSYIAR